jgi:hypothetical protein
MKPKTETMKNKFILLTAMLALPVSAATIMPNTVEESPPPGENVDPVFWDLGIPAVEFTAPEVLPTITLAFVRDEHCESFPTTLLEDIRNQIILEIGQSEYTPTTITDDCYDFESPPANFAAVPEPEKLLFGAASILFFGFRRRRS